MAAFIQMLCGKIYARVGDEDFIIETFCKKLGEWGRPAHFRSKIRSGRLWTAPSEGCARLQITYFWVH